MLVVLKQNVVCLKNGTGVGSVNGNFAKIRLRALTNSTNLVLLTANRIHLVLTGFPVELEANSDLE